MSEWGVVGRLLGGMLVLFCRLVLGGLEEIGPLLIF